MTAPASPARRVLGTLTTALFHIATGLILIGCLAFLAARAGVRWIARALRRWTPGRARGERPWT